MPLVVPLTVPNYVDTVTDWMEGVIIDAIATVRLNWAEMEEAIAEGSPHDQYGYQDVWSDYVMYRAWGCADREAFVLGWGIDRAFHSLCDKNKEDGLPEANDYNDLAHSYSLVDNLFSHIMMTLLDQVDWDTVRGHDADDELELAITYR